MKNKKEFIPKEEIEKLRIQLKKDILGYNQRLVNLTTQINRTIGAIMQAEGTLKMLKGGKDALCKKR